jgi:hypothetical protein
MNAGIIAGAIAGSLFFIGVAQFTYKRTCGPAQADPSKATEMHAI